MTNNKAYGVIEYFDVDWDLLGHTEQIRVIERLVESASDLRSYLDGEYDLRVYLQNVEPPHPDLRRSLGAKWVPI